MFGHFEGDAANIGSVVGIILGAIILGPAVHEIRILRVALRGATATGRVEAVREGRRDRYGDTVRWISVVSYWAEAGGKRREVRFDERLGYSHDKKKEIVVRYSPKKPDRLVTIRPPREVLAKAGGLTVLAVFFIAAGLWWLLGPH